jgi:GntR family transcriptional regulator
MFRIQVTAGSASPIYRQVVDQIRQAAASGKIAVGEALPSVRALAAELLINPNTIAKAYAALVRDGVLESQQGRGYFVSERRDIFSRKERQRRLEDVMTPFLAEALTLGFTAQQILNEVGKKLQQMQPSETAQSS